MKTKEKLSLHGNIDQVVLYLKFAPQGLYEFLEPGDEEIIAAYVTLNGPEPHESDADESSSSSSDEESDDADADEGEAGDSMQTE